MSRIERCAAQASAMIWARLVPMPRTRAISSGWRSITSSTRAPKAATRRCARAGPTPLMRPEARNRRRSSTVAGAVTASVSAWNWAPCARVMDPAALRLHELARRHARNMAHQGHDAAIAARPHLQDAEPCLVAVEGDALDRAGQALVEGERPLIGAACHGRGEHRRRKTAGRGTSGPARRGEGLEPAPRLR